jgi:hypothetical protein
MANALNGRLDAAAQPYALKKNETIFNLSYSFAQLTAVNRRKVLRIFERVVMNRDTCDCSSSSEDEMWASYAKLQPISQELANCWCRWASQFLKNGQDNCRRLLALVEGLIWEWWMEEIFGGGCPESLRGRKKDLAKKRG